jgi:uncharacterized membrane protein YdjX (TVP38/TMEM64 family)
MTEGDRPSVRWVRLAALATLAAGLIVAGRATGLSAYLSPERIRSVTSAAGPWGPILLVVVFCVSELANVPVVVLVPVAVVAYGRTGGGAISFVGAIAAVSVSFAVARGIGGKPLAAIRWSFARRVLARLEARPVCNIALLRLVLWMAPPLNYALALSNVRFRSYLVGTALGLMVPIAGLVLLSDNLLR